MPMLWFALGVILTVMGVFLRPSWLYWIGSVGIFAVFFQVSSTQWMAWLIFVIGLALLLIELYTPGFGLAGLSGILAMTYGLYEHYGQLESVLLMGVILIAVAALTVYLLVKLGCRPVVAHAFVLETALTRESGYTPSPDHQNLVGQVGQAVTPLRPVGRAQFDQEVYEVISHGPMIQSGTPVQVEAVRGSQIIVRQHDDQPLS